MVMLNGCGMGKALEVGCRQEKRKQWGKKRKAAGIDSEISRPISRAAYISLRGMKL